MLIISRRPEILFTITFNIHGKLCHQTEYFILGPHLGQKGFIYTRQTRLQSLGKFSDKTFLIQIKVEKDVHLKEEEKNK